MQGGGGGGGGGGGSAKREGVFIYDGQKGGERGQLQSRVGEVWWGEGEGGVHV